MGIYDALILPFNGMVTGIQVMLGAHFCNSPTVFYFSGVLPCVGFCGVVSISVLLALDRFLQMCFPNVAKICFDGNRAFIWMSIPFLFQIYSGFELLCVFNIKVNAMNPDPYFLVHGLENMPQFNFPKLQRFFVIQDSFIISSLLLLYSGLLIGLKLKTRITTTSSKLQRQMTIQAFIICGEIFIVTAFHAVMLFLEFPKILEVIAHFSWIFLHGGTPLVYFILNKTLRTSVIKMFASILKWKSRKASLSYISPTNKIASNVPSRFDASK